MSDWFDEMTMNLWRSSVRLDGFDPAGTKYKKGNKWHFREYEKYDQFHTKAFVDHEDYKTEAHYVLALEHLSAKIFEPVFTIHVNDGYSFEDIGDQLYRWQWQKSAYNSFEEMKLTPQEGVTSHIAESHNQKLVYSFTCPFTVLQALQFIIERDNLIELPDEIRTLLIENLQMEFFDFEQVAVIEELKAREDLFSPPDL